MKLGPLIERMISAGMSPGDAGAIAAEIYAAGMASASVRSTGAERTRRYRQNKASQSDGLRHQTSHGDDEAKASQSVTERHKASQSDVSPVSPIDTKIKNSKRQSSERPSRGTRLDETWSPSHSDREAALAEGFSGAEIEREALRFRDYWKAKAGSGGVKLDWSATWRNWIRTSAERSGKAPRAVGEPVCDGMFQAKADSEELHAWDSYRKKNEGKTYPRDRNGGWRVPARWPPGYVPLNKSSESPPIPNLRSMQ